MWFLEVPSQFSKEQTLQSLTCSIMGWMTDLNMLLSCFREKMSGGSVAEMGNRLERILAYATDLFQSHIPRYNQFILY